MENTECWAKSQWCHPCNVRLISYFSSLLKDKLHRFPGRKCRSLTVLRGENIKPGFNWILPILGRKPLYCVNQIQDKRSCFLLHQKILTYYVTWSMSFEKTLVSKPSMWSRKPRSPYSELCCLKKEISMAISSASKSSMSWHILVCEYHSTLELAEGPS